MSLTFNLLLLLILFIALGIVANYTVNGIKYLGCALKIKLSLLGIILGLMTSLPEFFVGINSILEGAPAISVGNLLSGMIVLLTLILGINLVLNRKIITDGKLITLIPTIIVILSPILFGLNGYYSALEGVMMIIFYITLIIYIFTVNRNHLPKLPSVMNGSKSSKAILVSIAGSIGILVISQWIIKITLTILRSTNLNELMIGTLIFGPGTNLPEIVVAITAWHKKSASLSLSHLLSSAFSNVLILGIMVLINPIELGFNLTFLLIALFLPITMFTFLKFYVSGKRMDRKEGFVLIAIYIVFVVLNIFLLRINP